MLMAVYYKSPVLVQNIFVSLKGLHLHITRKLGNYRRYKLEVVDRSSFSREKITAYQNRELSALIKYVVENVPYYSRRNIDKCMSDDFIADINRFPILSRREVVEHSEELVPRDIDAKKILSVHTTGTSGSPLDVKTNRDARQKNYAYFDAYLESLGIKANSKHIVIGGRVVIHPKVSKPPFWRSSIFQRSLLMSSYHLSDEYLDSYVDKIASYSPEYIESYPSSIYTIASYIVRKKRKVSCGAVLTSAETLLPEQRAVIEEAFHAKVYDQYGSAEMCAFVAQCGHGKYHVRPDYGLLEIVDGSGSPVEPGEYGNIVCTGLVNKVMPLLRYEIGDIAAFSTDSGCSCGMNTPILEGINGRIDDTLYAIDGRPVGRMSPVLKGFPIRESQYVQNKLGEICIYLVPDDGYSPEFHMQRIIDAIQLRMGKDTIVNVRLVDKIARGAGGKLRSVISNVRIE